MKVLVGELERVLLQVVIVFIPCDGDERELSNVSHLRKTIFENDRGVCRYEKRYHDLEGRR